MVEAAFGSPAEARLVEAIRASPEYRPELALVAVDGDTVVGHVMVSGATLRDGDPGAERGIVMLSPLAVAPDRHGQGIGSALVREVVARADAAGEPLVVLEGNPAFYGRLGFEASAPRGITLPLPDWAPENAAQLVRLRTYDPGIRGHVVYPPSFAEVSEPTEPR